MLHRQRGEARRISLIVGGRRLLALKDNLRHAVASNGNDAADSVTQSTQPTMSDAVDDALAKHGRNDAARRRHCLFTPSRHNRYGSEFGCLWAHSTT